MKSFKEYLTESKKTYDFKVKIAGDCPKDCATKIKEALAMYDITSCSAGSRAPIQENQTDFPELKNVGVTVYDICLNYPTTSREVRACVAEKLNFTESSIKVRNPAEEAEVELNHEHDEATGEALLEKPELEEIDGQKLVGDKHVMSMLKELNKHKTTGTQVKGTNDKLLAKKAPAEKAVAVKADNKIGTTSPVGNRKITKPQAKTAGGL